MPTIDHIVRSLLAHHLDRAPSTLQGSLNLSRDLDVTPLELVLVALDLEEIEGVSIPVEQLGQIETVGELVDFLAATVREQRRGRLRVA